MMGVHHGFASLDLETEQLVIVADPECDLPGSFFNDGKCDPAGRFWAGTHFSGSEQLGSLYRLDPDLSVHRMVEGVKGSNGIAWSLDGTQMYYIDTALRLVYAFDYGVETGEIENRRIAFDVPKEMGYPDGMTIDSEGMLWVALFNAFKVTRWDPVAGRLLQTLDVPAFPTSCAFGGPDLDQLYITTLRRWQDAEKLERYPLTGGLFRADVGVTGIPAFEFAG